MSGRDNMGWGGGCLIDGKPFSFYVPHDGEEMNKQQLIDKAIDDLKGVWPLHGPNWIAIGGNCLTEHKCTRQEFEARKAEREKDKQEAEKMLGMINSSASLPKQDHWYDYENQKALRLPPVGEVCEMYAAASWFDVKVIAFDDGKLIVKYLWCGNYYPASQSVKFYRPLDWDKKQISDTLELVGIMANHIAGGVGITDAAKAILAAGYRKCHNKTPSDKE